MTQPRRWFQLHLSTAIVLMFVAGGLIWVNVVPQHYVEERRADDSWLVSYSVRGWPLHWEVILNSEQDMSPTGLMRCVPFLVNLIMLASVAVTLEYFIRRRKPQT